MDDAELRRILEKAAADVPRIPGIDLASALAVCTIRALEKRFPGIRDEIRAEIVASAERMEASESVELREDAPSMREIADSWVFME